MKKTEWYAAKTVYKLHRREGGVSKVAYEERVVLFHAQDFDDAISQAEAEARQYCGKDGDVVYLGYVDVYHLFDENVGTGTEVYSLMRESLLPEREYLDNFYDTGRERTQAWRGTKD